MQWLDGDKDAGFVSGLDERGQLLHASEPCGFDASQEHAQLGSVWVFPFLPFRQWLDFGALTHPVQMARVHVGCTFFMQRDLSCLVLACWTLNYDDACRRLKLIYAFCARGLCTSAVRYG